MNHKFELAANGLQLTSFPSSAFSIDDMDSPKLSEYLREHFDIAKIVLWLDNEVRIGLWSENNFHFYKSNNFEFRYVQRLRAFNADKEIHIWRSREGWKGRIRIDKDGGEETDVVIAHQLLFGTKGERLDSQFIKLEEKRGTNLILPLANFKFNNNGNPQSRIFIMTHNYVKTNEMNQATYYDCRFVAFTNGKQELS